MSNPILGTAVMSVPITALYGALTMLLVVGLGLNVSRVRGKHKVFHGDGGNKTVAMASRAHGNLVEHAPMILLLMLVAELCGGTSTMLHVFGASLLVARLLHAFGLLAARMFGSLVGATLTYVLELGIAIYVLTLRPWS